MIRAAFDALREPVTSKAPLPELVKAMVRALRDASIAGWKSIGGLDSENDQDFPTPDEDGAVASVIWALSFEHEDYQITEEDVVPNCEGCQPIIALVHAVIIMRACADMLSAVEGATDIGYFFTDPRSTWESALKALEGADE